MEENNSFKEAYLGIHGFDFDVVKYLHLGENIESGIYVEQILENSPVVDVLEKRRYNMFCR